MKGHPGGEAHTRALLDSSGLTSPAKVLDMGAGAGEAVALLQKLGFEALGLDLEPRGPRVERGDFLRTPWPDGSFDGVLSQCAFYVSGDVPGAFREAARLLKPGGVLMLSDVCPGDRDLENLARQAGLRVLAARDLTPLWKEYYIEALWRGTADYLPRGQKFRYIMLIAKKEGTHGPV